MTTTTPEGYLVESPWDGRRTLAVFLTWLAGGIVGGFLASAIGFDVLDSAAGLAVVIAAQSAAALLAVTLYSQSRGTGSLVKDVGLRVEVGHWYGLLLGFVLQWAVGLVLLPLVELMNIDSEPQAVSDLAAGTLDASGRTLLFVSFVIAAPVVEEVLFRGVLLGWLSKRMKRPVAIVTSAAIFGLTHWEGPDVLLPVIGLFLIGIVLAYVVTRYGNLSMAILMHAGINLLAFLVLVFEDRILEWIDELESSVGLLVGWLF